MQEKLRELIGQSGINVYHDQEPFVFLNGNLQLVGTCFAVVDPDSDHGIVFGLNCVARVLVKEKQIWISKKVAFKKIEGETYAVVSS